MNTYAEMQRHRVEDRQQALRNEARDARLLATASPLPAVSAGSRAAADTTRTWPADGEPIAMAHRSLGSAAATARPAVRPPHGASEKASAAGSDPCTGERSHAAA
jgi:hypothetical protein